MRSGEKMIVALGYIFLIGLFAAGCGKTDSSASDNVNTGAIVRVTEIMSLDRGADTQDIDMRLSVCEMDGATIVSTEDPLTEASMRVTILNDTDTLSCSGDAPCPYVYILSYKVEFESDDPNAVPLDSIQRDVYLPIEGGADATMEGWTLMAWSSKRKFYNYYNSWGSIVPYTAKITFKGENEFGEEFEFKTQIYLEAGDWWVCN